MLALSLTCRAERKGMIALKRKLAMAMLSTLFAELPVRGPLLRSNDYEIGRPDRPWPHMHEIITARVDPQTLNVVVNSSIIGSPLPDRDWTWVIIPDAHAGVVYKKDGDWTIHTNDAVGFVRTLFEDIHMWMAFKQYNSFAEFVEKWAIPRGMRF